MFARTLLRTSLALAGLATVSLPAFAGGTYDLTYAQDIKPILDNNCVECHPSGGRDPDLRQFPFQSKKLGGLDAIVTKDTEVTGGATPKMPPGQRDKLTSDQVNTISQWHSQGMKP